MGNCSVIKYIIPSKEGNYAFQHMAALKSSGKVLVCLFSSSNWVMSCLTDQMKDWFKMFVWAGFCGLQQSCRAECVLDSSGLLAGGEH